MPLDKNQKYKWRELTVCEPSRLRRDYQNVPTNVKRGNNKLSSERFNANNSIQSLHIFDNVEKKYCWNILVLG